MHQTFVLGQNTCTRNYFDGFGKPTPILVKKNQKSVFKFLQINGTSNFD